MKQKWLAVLISVALILVLAACATTEEGEKPSSETTDSTTVPTRGSGDIDFSDLFTNDKTSGETPTGENPSDEPPTGENPSDETPTGENPSDETPTGEKPSEESTTAESPGVTKEETNTEDGWGPFLPIH